MKIRWGAVMGRAGVLCRHVCIDGLWLGTGVWREMTLTGWRWFANHTRGDSLPHVTMREAMKEWRENYKIQLAERALEQ